MRQIWEAIVRQFDEKRNFALATILSVEGSSPRKVGAKILALDNGELVGTIGGGLFEANVCDVARVCLNSGVSVRRRFAFLGKDIESDQMICGGSVEVLIEFVSADSQIKEKIYRKLLGSLDARVSSFLLKKINLAEGESISGEIQHLCVDDRGSRFGDFPDADECVGSIPPRRLIKPAQFLTTSEKTPPVLLEWVFPRNVVYIFGAGHVGAALCHLASYVDFEVVMIDDRDEYANPENLPDASETIVANFENAFSSISIDQDSYIVIVTKGHAHDRTTLSHALKTKACYIGMIGSQRKTKLIFDSLVNEGFAESDLERVHAPIGLSIGGETPQEIAVSIVAELIQARTNKLNRKRDQKNA